MNLPNSRVIIGLCILDILWSLSALIYDFQAIQLIPLWARIFVIICPLYPLLLTLVWTTLLKQMIHPWLFSIAVLPSAVYGVLGLFFYPLTMYFDHYSWEAVFQIGWVLFYSLQAWYLLRIYNPPLLSKLFAVLFITLSLGVQFLNQTFGYLAVDVLPAPAQYFLLSLAAITCIFLLKDQRRIMVL